MLSSAVAQGGSSHKEESLQNASRRVCCMTIKNIYTSLNGELRSEQVGSQIACSSYCVTSEVHKGYTKRSTSC